MPVAKEVFYPFKSPPWPLLTALKDERPLDDSHACILALWPLHFISETREAITYDTSVNLPQLFELKPCSNKARTAPRSAAKFKPDVWPKSVNQWPIL